MQIIEIAEKFTLKSLEFCSSEHPPILVWALFLRLSAPFFFLTLLPSPFLHCGEEFQAFLPTQSPPISI